jgi:hypothetical protein
LVSRICVCFDESAIRIILPAQIKIGGWRPLS